MIERGPIAAKHRKESLERIAEVKDLLVELSDQLKEAGSMTIDKPAQAFRLAKEWSDSAWRNLDYAERYLEQI